MAVLAEFEAQMAEFDPSLASLETVQDLITHLHHSRRVLLAFEDALTEAAERHEATGKAPPAEDILTGDGAASKRGARDARRRRSAAAQMGGLSASMRRGDARAENVESIARALSRLTDDAHREAFVQADAELTLLAEALAPDEFARRLDGFVRRAMADDGATRFERQRAASRLSLWVDRDGMTRLSGSFDPEWGAILSGTINAEMRSLASAGAKASDDLDNPGGEPGNQQSAFGDRLRAEALVERLRRSDRTSGVGRGLPLIGIVRDHRSVHHGPHPGTVSEFENGTHCPHETTVRLTCDAAVHDIVVDEAGLPLSVGRRYRTATDAQRLALRVIYRTCAWPGCDRTFEHCQIHHVVPWEHGGPTDLDNLVPLCSRHHHLAHEGGWALKIEADRSLWIWRPDGSLHHCGPPGGPPRHPKQDMTL